LLLGIVGLLVAVFRKGSGIGFAIAGSAISGLALFVAVGSTVVAGKALEVGAKSMSTAMKEGDRTNQEVIPAGEPEPVRAAAEPRPRQLKDKFVPAPQTLEPRQDEPAPEAGQPQQGAAPAPGPTKEPESEAQWASATDTVRQGDVTVRIKSVVIGKVPLKDQIRGSRSASADPLLAIEVEIANVGLNKKVQYQTFMGRGFSLGLDYTTLRDNFDNIYKRIDFGFSSKPTGATESESIYPGKSITDVLIFEPPIETAQYLNLELPAQNFGGTGMLRIRIPMSMVGGKEPDAAETVIIYRTTHSSPLYHRRDCELIRKIKSSIELSLARARELKLRPCKKCNPPQ
jgi:hypothetical protein